MPLKTASRSYLPYLLQEAALIPILGYFFLLGGTHNGLVLFRLNLITTALLAALWLAWLGYALYRRAPLPRTALDWPLLALILAQLLATALSLDPRRSAIPTWLLVSYALIFYLTVDLLRRGWPAELWVKSMLIVGGLVIALSLIEVVYWYASWLDIGSLAQPFPPVNLRIRSFLGHGNYAAAFVNLLLPFAAIRLIRSRALLPRLFLTLWLAGAAVVLYFSSSRGGWLGTATAVAVTVALALHVSRSLLRPAVVWRRLKARPWAVAWLGLGIGGGLAGMVWLLAQQARHPSHGQLSSRLVYWSTAWRAFLNSPIWGNGPGTYGHFYLQFNSVPTGAIYVHAHNYWLNTAAESGLIGVIAAAWLALTIAIALANAWRQTGSEHRWLMVGAVGGLISLLPQNMVDLPVDMPTISLMIAVVLALALTDQTRSAPPRPAPSIGWLLIPAGVLIAAAAWSTWAYQPFHRGVVAAAQDRWPAAAALLDEAAARDPRLAFYHLQSGFAHGTLAAQPGGQDHLAPAIASYERGIALEPNYSVNHANLATLYWQAGRPAEAIAHLQRAVTLAPAEPLWALNLGRYYEALGQREAARQQYEQVLSWHPAPAAFWRATPFREEVWADWQRDHPLAPPPDSPQSYEDYVALGQRALADDDLATAVAVFTQAIRLAPGRAEGYLGLGQASLSQGRYAQADEYLRIANFTYAPAPQTAMNILFTWGQLARRQGQPAQATARYERALDFIRHRTSQGLGMMGVSEYGWYMFHRESIAPDLLPQLSRVDVTDEIAQRYFELGQMYEESDRIEKAIATYRELLAAAPDFAPARERLAALGVPPDRTESSIAP